jgi:hypothetical protein
MWKGKRNSNVSVIKKSTVTSVDFSKSYWWHTRDANGTLEEWMKKSDADLAVIEDDVCEIHKLLDEV